MTDALGLELLSTITSGGRLELSLAEVPVPEPGPGEVLVRIEAAPVNPSDLGLLLGPADVTTLRSVGTVDRPAATADVPTDRLAGLVARLDTPMPVGNEGAGVVVAAAPELQSLVGRTVALRAAGTYAHYRTARASACVVLPEGTTARDGASAFVNPLTALGMVETMRREGHTALVHTAAASNLGQMLNRICLADGVGLVNVVRSSEQAALLRDLGAEHVLDSTAAGFTDGLTEALVATGATLAFDAVGGGPLASQVLGGMERALSRGSTTYSRYGSSTHKQVYVYGGLDRRPTQLDRAFGMAWGVGGWLLTTFLQQVGRAEAQRLGDRVAAELTTTFASHYTSEVTLAELVSPEVLLACSRTATGEKHLVVPARA